MVESWAKKMNGIHRKIKKAMTEKRKGRIFSLESFLCVASKVYGGAVKLRREVYKAGILKTKRLPCMVISIGNIVAGGTGKTPMTIYVAGRIKKYGYKVVVISRGYRGKAEKTGGIVSDGESLLMDCKTAGDEPYMMASRLKNVPVIVGKNRFKAGMTAVKKFNPDVIVLDDAFQHIKLERDFDLVLLDYQNPFGNGHILPAGTLREPVSILFKGDGFIFTRSDTAKDNNGPSLYLKLPRYVQKKPVFRAIHIPFISKIVNKGKNNTSGQNLKESIRKNAECLKGRNAYAFSGIADNNVFFKTVKSFDCLISAFSEFEDHHFYSDTDIERILEGVKKSGSDCIITTEKDFVRLPKNISWPVEMFVVGIKIEFAAGNKQFDALIMDRLIKR